MRSIFLQVIFITIFLLSWITPAQSEFDWKIVKQLKLQQPPLDVAVSPNEKWYFVLSKGEIIIFSSEDGQVQNSIPVDASVEKIIHSPEDNSLILISAKEKTIKVLRVDAIYHFTEKKSPHLGPENAPVTLTIFSHYQCPFCAQIDPKIEELCEFYEDELRIIFKAFPSYNREAVNAWTGALAADRQNKFWEYHKALHKKERPLKDEKILSAARELGLDMKKFKKDMEDPAVLKQITRDVNEGIDAEVASVPTFFINGKHLKNEEIDQIYQFIQEELKRN